MTFTKDKAKELRNAFECWQQDYDPVDDKEQYDMFGSGMDAMDALLASLEAESVYQFWNVKTHEWVECDKATHDSFTHIQRRVLYTAPPAPVSVPAGYRLQPISEYDAMCAAMLQGAAGNSPVISDDVRRMDWLVSKTVDVREPMVYGSHSLFWSQTITDEEDDYHATKLREQIDAAIAAENAAAPQQEMKS